MARIDASADPPAPRHRPAHRQWRYIGLVAAGGALGTALRAAVTLLAPETRDFPVATFGVNLLGAFLLGVLLEALARSGPGMGGAHALRLFVGTGVLGGFTTYSALAAASAGLTVTGLTWWAAVYA